MSNDKKERVAYNPMDNRPKFPKRAVITGGMPYGNKELHLGHVGGVFIHADMFARFLRARIGSENVIFVSGTDCYGSPIDEYYRQLVEKGQFNGSIEDFVVENHNKQKNVLDKYNISLNLFSASGLGRSKEIHAELCNEFFLDLYNKGALVKIENQQFFDEKEGKVLNGRQVIGKCPIAGCQSTKAYSDECALGHQYLPKDLIDPKSVLTSETPTMVSVSNWYFDLEKYVELIKKYVDTHKNMRPLVNSTITEFLKPPIIFVRTDDIEIVNKISSLLPKYELGEEQRKSSYTLTFKTLVDRDKACGILGSNGVRFRNGKTLVPFRLTGNAEWGVPAPDLEDLKDMTFWVWPESLWAPISFTKAYLESINSKNTYKDWWYKEDSEIYQFVGSDNIYFYGIAEMGMFMATQGEDVQIPPTDGKLRLPNIVANNHVLFLDKKVSSSDEIKPPTAEKLLEFYTPEQLRAHFLAFGLGSKSVGFKPKPLNPDAKEGENDPVLVEGSLYTNVFNRLVRTFFYSVQKYNEGNIPVGKVSEELIKDATDSICKYEKHMYKFEFHRVIDVLDSYTRKANKHFVKYMNEAGEENTELINKTLVEGLFMIRVIMVLSHPIAVNGAEMILNYLNLSEKAEEFWSWDNIFNDIYYFIDTPENHKFKYLEPKIDFYSKLDCQF